MNNKTLNIADNGHQKTGDKRKNKMIRVTMMLGLSLLAILPVTNISAVELGQQGLGQVLIYPYYTTRNGNTTLLQVTNTTRDTKALKVQVLEGDNGHSVLTVNVYLGPNDVWTASLGERMTTDGNRVPVLTSQDISCTVPAGLSNDGVNVEPDAAGILSAAAFTAPPDGGRQSEDRLKEGYVQIIEMGTLAPEIAFFALHDGSNMPIDCSFFVDAWENSGAEPGIFRLDPQADMLPPSGGLFGDALIINVPGARAAAYQAEALNGFYMPAAGLNEPSLHSAPESPGMGLAAATPPVSRVLLPTETGVQIIEDTWDNGLQAVNAVLMADQVVGQYAAELFISGATEWVLTFPGKQAHVSQVDSPVPPYTSLFGSTLPDIFVCEVFETFFFNREQARPPLSGPPTIPPPIPPPQLCYEVNLVTFNEDLMTVQDSTANEQENIASNFLASRLYLDFDLISSPGFETGWFSVAFNGDRVEEDNVQHMLVNPTSGRTYRGLPVVGFAVRGAENRPLNALFGTGFRHNYQRVILPAE